MLCCYHPTSVFAIDDNHEFLTALSQHLSLPNLSCFSSPSKALALLQPQNPFSEIQSTLITTTRSHYNDTDDVSEQEAIIVNLRKLHHIINDANRFDTVSVILIDYHMDKINGIDICQQLTKHPAKKILLTGGQDKEKIAIEAFNNGIIHRFINKSDPNFTTHLKYTIALLKEAYFRDLTNAIIPDSHPIMKLLRNASYHNFCRNLHAQVNADEYYLLDNSGSILYFTNNEPTWLIIRSIEELENYANIASETENGDGIAEKIRNRKSIPFFFTENDFNTTVCKWETYMHKAHPLPGVKGYYYSIINGDTHGYLDRTQMITRSSDANSRVQTFI